MAVIGTLTFKRPVGNRLEFWQESPGSLTFNQSADGIGLLLFEPPDDAPIPQRNVTLDYTLPGLVTDIQIGRVLGVSLDYTLPGLVADFQATYDINTFRGIKRSSQLPWRDADPIRRTTRLPGGLGERTQRSTRLPWRDAEGLRKNTRLPSGEASPTRTVHRLPWRDAIRQQRTTSSVSDTPIRQGIPHRLPWRDAARLQRTTSSQDAQPLRLGIGTRLPWGNARLIRKTYGIPWRDAILTARLNRLCWRDARKPPAGRGPARPPDRPPRPRVIGKLEFRCPAPGFLNFGPHCFGTADYLVPPRRTYTVTNTASLARIIDSEPIPATELTFSLDWSSWAWQASATFPDIAAAELLNGNPTEVVATINGFQWRAILERPSTARGFIEQSASATGLSLAGWLAAPYAARNSKAPSTAKTAQQLCLEELPTGWGLEWLIDDWTIPGGAFSYQNLTAIEVIQRIAAAAGAIVQADRQLRRVTIQRKWPSAPWAWPELTPDATLPADYLDSESIQSQTGQNYNAVLVYGDEPNGIMVRARINGTAGDRPAPDVHDPLMVDALTGRYRAIQAMADSRPNRRATLIMDLQAQPAGAGLILPGQLLDLDEAGAGYRALSTGCRVTARVEGDGFVDVEQQVEVLIDG